MSLSDWNWSYQIAPKVMRCESIDHGAKLLFAHLDRHLDLHDNNPTNFQLEIELGVSRRTIQRWLKQLAQENFISMHVEVSQELKQTTRYIKIARDL